MANFRHLTLTKETFINFFFFEGGAGQVVENVNDEACSSFLFAHSFHWSCTLHIMHNIYHK